MAKKFKFGSGSKTPSEEVKEELGPDTTAEPVADHEVPQEEHPPLEAQPQVPAPVLEEVQSTEPPPDEVKLTQEVLDKVPRIAELAHEINRAYCHAIGDHSQPPWGMAPKWQRDSAVAGVLAHLKNPRLSPRDSHENWLKQKKAEGWVWGDVKDPDKKTHPCMKDYIDLPQEQQVKDHLFKAMVRLMKE